MTIKNMISNVQYHNDQLKITNKGSMLMTPLSLKE